MSTTTTASQLKSLHLLRALLREVTYLPDLTARNYFRRYVVARFKAYQPKPNATRSFDVQAVEKYRHHSFKRRHLGTIHERAEQQQRKAQKGLNFLRRANQGEGACIQKVLWFAYGRLGRRKYALLNDLLKPDSAWEGEPAPLQKLYRSNMPCLQYFEAPRTRQQSNVINISDQYPRLKAVIWSQCENRIALRRPMKSRSLTTPLLNIWMRPMPLKRAANNVRRWYAETMTRLLPALPIDEWDRIDAMSKGQQRIGFVRRRTPVDQPDCTPAPAQPSLEQNLRHHLAMDKPSKAERSQRLNNSTSHITARYMRRLYSRLLMQTCKLEYDDTRKRWNATWGEMHKSSKATNYTVLVNDALFSGVDDKGLLLKAETNDAARSDAQVRSHMKNQSRFPFFAEYLPETHPVRIELDAMKKEREAARARLAKGGDAPAG